MSYNIRGYAFDKDGNPHKLIDGLVVSGWDEAHKLFKDNNYEHYIITLDKIQEKEE